MNQITLIGVVKPISQTSEEKCGGAAVKKMKKRPDVKQLSTNLKMMKMMKNALNRKWPKTPKERNVFAANNLDMI